MNEQLLTTARKNQTSSYGLTLVAGLPFPPHIFAQIQATQQQLEKSVPHSSTWYQRHHTHLTLYAPLRSRVRAHPPLTRQELPPNLDQFIEALRDCILHLSPFVISIGKVRLTDIGHFIVPVEGATIVKTRLVTSLNHFAGIETPKNNWVHGTIGYLHQLPTEAQGICLQQELASSNIMPIGQMLVEQISLVHYAHRTLNHIKGRISLTLGQPNDITTANFLQMLNMT